MPVQDYINAFIAYVQTNTLECFGAAFSILNVVLAARGNILCWPVGIIGAAAYVYLNYAWQYYHDMVLQSFYVFAGFYGWWKWTGNRQDTAIEIVKWSFSRQIPLLALGIVLSLVLGSISYYFLHQWVTYFDATLTAFSFIATWMMAKKIIDNWVWWIILDTAGIGLYWMKDARVTCFLYLVLTLGAIYAYYNWQKQLALQTKTSQL